MVHLNKLLFHQGPLGWVNDLSQIHAYGKTIKHGYFHIVQFPASHQLAQRESADLFFFTSSVLILVENSTRSYTRSYSIFFF